MYVPSMYQLEFFDSEHLQECIKDSDAIHKQVTKGKFRGILKRIIFPDIVIDNGQYNLRLQAEGTFPEQAVTLIIVHRSDEIGKAWGEELKGGDLMVVFPDEEAELTIPSGSSWTSINVPKALMHDYNLHITKSEIYTLDTKKFQRFNIFFNFYISLFDTKIFSYALLQDMIISLFIRTIEHADNRVELSYKNSCLLALNVRDEILEHIDDDLQMKNLCQLTGMSVRTIERSFKQFFGISPRDYHTYHRFFLIRQTLLHDKNTSVSNAALKYGYMHLGRFSQKYKEIFGELPSQSLKKK